MKQIVRLAIVATGFAGAIAIACGGSDDDGVASSSGSTPPADAGPRGAEPAGQACTAPAQCYAGVDGGADGGGIVGEVTCLTKIPNGYCTHTCQQDSDCCAARGECLTGVKQVCSPFENQATKYCFLSCEEDDMRAAIEANSSAGYYDGGAVDAESVEDAFCRSYASVYARCRSSGGGSQNRKVCIPRQ
jgi:hypothetical protein